MEETYEVVIDKANAIIRGYPRAEEGTDPRPERTVLIAAQRRDLHEKITEILNHVKKELENVEVTHSQGFLKVHRESLVTTELMMREAKELTKELTEELLGHQHDDWPALMADEHRKRMELDRRQLQLRTLIAGLEDLIPPQQIGGDGAVGRVMKFKY